MKSAKLSTRTSKRPWGDGSTTFSAMPAIEETYVDSIAAVDLVGYAKDVYPSIAPPLSLWAMMQSIMTTQATQGQLLDELLIEVALMRPDFLDYRSSFPPSSPFQGWHCLWQYVTKRGSSFMYIGGVLCFIFSFDVFIFLFLDIFFVSLKHWCDEIMIVDDS